MSIPEFGKKILEEDRGSTTSSFSLKKRRSQADELVEIVETAEDKPIFFKNELGEPFVNLLIVEHRETWHVRSRIFKQWLYKYFYERCGKVPNAEAVNSALNVISAKAVHEGDQHYLSNRAAWHEGDIWYDLTDKKWRAVKITADGWEVVNNPLILFRRYSHQQQQVEPIRGGDARELLRFINLRDERQKLLYLTWIISCFIPDFPHPVPSKYGAQGSAKSMASKLTKKLLDPSALEIGSFPKESREFAQFLSHHWYLPFDNVSHLPEWISDMICRAVTGDGFSKRELFSDDDDIIYTFKRCISLNGINLVATRPDLLERSILFELERIPEKERKTEKKLLKEFEEARPRILGGIFDAISGALRYRPQVNLMELPRMADFTEWGCAIVQALGYAKEDFLDAYHANIRGQNEEVLTGSLIATVVRTFMEDKEEWIDTPSRTLDVLKSKAVEMGIGAEKEREWPKSAKTLTRELNKLKTNLATEGIQIEQDRSATERKLIFRNIKNNIVTDVISSLDADISPKPNDNRNDDITREQGISSS